MKTQKRHKLHIKPTNKDSFIKKALYWADKSDRFAYFNSNHYEFPHSGFKNFLAIGTYLNLSFNGQNDFKRLNEEVGKQPDFWIGHFTYDLKNQLEKLSSSHPNFPNFKPISFFIPTTIIHLEKDWMIESFEDPSEIYQKILDVNVKEVSPMSHKPRFRSEVTKNDYIKVAKKLREYIIEGDIYEINYCHEYTSENISIDPIATYLTLNRKVPSPFSTLYKNHSQYLLSASPERFLKKEGRTLISQPIKGTSPRSDDPFTDRMNKKYLTNSEKELAENMMIVDLVRNDLARSCKSGSVKVDEIFKVYSFPLWHQMISTISGELKTDVNLTDCIKNAFPMGSMTGAPKIKVMQLIEKYEKFQRNIYSGSIGYFLPNGDFDFNVIIRSLFYDKELNKSSFAVGGAITYDSTAEEEYTECQLKAKTFQSLFEIAH